jgi:hypothetical protein
VRGVDGRSIIIYNKYIKDGAPNGETVFFVVVRMNRRKTDWKAARRGMGIVSPG